LFAYFFLIQFYGLAQLTDQFSDGELTTNPSWSGDLGLFAINNGELQSLSSGAATYYLSTPSTLSLQAQWEFFFNFKFSTSGANYADIYLMSDNADLNAVSNGYFIRIGNTADEISLYKIEASIESILIDGTDGLVNSTSNNPFNIRVSRSDVGFWELEIDDGATGTYLFEGSVTENTITTSSFFGIKIIQSTAAGPINNHFFDNISVSEIIPDTQPPSVVSINAVSYTEIDVKFDESVNQSTAELFTNYFVDGSIGSPIQAILDGLDNTIVHLTFPVAFTNNTDYVLTTRNIEDINSNMMPISNTNFTFLIPDIAAIGDIIINEFMADPNPPIGLPDAEFVEIYNASTKIIDLQNYTLSGSTISTIPYLLLPNEYLILCDDADTSLFQPYGSVLGVPAWNILTNTGETITLKDENNLLIIDQVSYTTSWYNDASKENGGYSIELINPNSPCLGQYNWGASNSTIGGTPGVINSVYDNTPDITPPAIISVEVVSSDSIIVEFDEPIESSSISTAVFNFSPFVSIQEVLESAKSQFFVLIKLASPLPLGTLYNLSVSDLSDCSGNSITNNIFEFRTYEKALIGDIIINEIMADPLPSQGLPEVEYIELFNNSNKYFDLKGYTLSNAAIITTSFEFAPYEHLILCKSGEEVLFESYGKVIGVPSWSPLTNIGKNVILKNISNGVVIDEVNYSDSWYQDTQKDNGGFSLELINPNSLCKGASNWIASSSQEGGTPGNQNSVFNNSNDSIPPKLLSVAIISEDTIMAQFDEFLDVSSLPLSSFFITSTATVSVIGLSSNSKSVLLKVSEMLLITETYTLTANGLSDCLGNIMLAEETTFFQLPEVAILKDIIINEFMPDPLDQVGLPEKEFVELYNRSNKQFNLADYTLNGKPISLDYFQLSPNDFVILCEENAAINYAPFGKTIGMTSWDVLTNSGETITLKDTKNNIIVDELSYTRNWYNSTIKNQGGWSLELIDTENLCSNEDNWTASVQPVGGTPGSGNSVSASKPDLTGPILEEVIVISADTLLLTFNENLDSTSIISANYTIDNISSVEVIFTTLKSVKLRLQTDLIPKQLYNVSVNNIKDCNGNLISNGFNTVALPEEAELRDIVLNEVLFNPRVNAPDFVELYNRSDKFINIQNWFLGNKDNNGGYDNLKKIIEKPFIVAPEQYVVLTKDEMILANEYPNGKRQTFLEMMSVPTYPNETGSVLILKPDTTVYEEFDYHEDFHHILLNNVDGISLERINIDGITNNPDNWHSAASTVLATPGYINSQSSQGVVPEDVITVSPQVIIPDLNGTNDFTTIRYEFDKPGYVVSVYIIDDRGRSTKNIIENSTLPILGELYWDGTTEDGRKARIGSYMVYVKAFDTSGNMKHYRKRVVVGSDW
ncbi:MAG: lamin tail domain-containing protein, partial [Cyclobacteriaceae bacterium]|nr:lamin tail domain-containing protein [Cyclobacteriaceae bacterium]